jgi:hypothetical protein
MSQTLFIKYGDAGFWAYDVAVGVFLKYLIDRAGQHIERQPSAWLNDCVKQWRVNAVMSEYGLHLDPTWTDDQRQTVSALIDDACQELQKAKQISADEAASWKILDGEGIHSRGAPWIPTAPAVELGRAIGLLLEGALPKAPSGSWWFYGTEGGVSMIKKGT